MVGISHLQQLYLNTNRLDLIIMRKPNGESHTYVGITERQLSGKQFSIMYIRKQPYPVIRKSKLAGCNIHLEACRHQHATDPFIAASSSLNCFTNLDRNENWSKGLVIHPSLHHQCLIARPDTFSAYVIVVAVVVRVDVAIVQVDVVVIASTGSRRRPGVVQRPA
jgi:hypothetical protein